MSRHALLRLALIPMVAMLQATAHGATACAPGFTEFLQDFEQARIDRDQHTKFPLRYTAIDGGAPMPRNKTSWLDRDEARKVQAFPSPAYQAELGLQRKISKDKAGRCEVFLFIPESDMYVVTFTFSRWNKTWRLVAVADQSL